MRSVKVDAALRAGRVWIARRLRGLANAVQPPDAPPLSTRLSTIAPGATQWYGAQLRMPGRPIRLFMLPELDGLVVQWDEADRVTDNVAVKIRNPTARAVQVTVAVLVAAVDGRRYPATLQPIDPPPFFTFVERPDA